MNKNTSEAHAPPTPRVRYEFGEKVGGEQMQVEHKTDGRRPQEPVKRENSHLANLTNLRSCHETYCFVLTDSSTTTGPIDRVAIYNFLC